MDSASARRIDAHNHVRGRDGTLDKDDAERVLEAAARLDIDMLCISRPLTSDAPKPDEFRASNDIVLQAMELSDRFLGFCFVNPGYAREAVAEIERCVTQCGMVGVKLYHQYTVCDPAQRPVMECAAALGVPVLMHAGKATDADSIPSQPRLSHAAHFVEAARAFPDTTLIQGHIGGGGDWEWNLRILEQRPNTYIDSSGSVVDADIVTRTVAALGADRVLFATDGSFEEGIGKVLDADLTDTDRDLVFAGNLKRLLAKRKT